jgi:hypothetical protein
MKMIFTLLLLIFFSSLTKAQLCTTDNRFTNEPFFSDAQINSQLNVTYANAINWTGNNEVLKLDVYYPDLAIDILPLRPLILMVHGGGLVSGDKINYTRVCTEFAKRGFVAVTINYRLGLACSTDVISEEKAKYRAQQDIHAAFRFVVQNAPAFRVDTSALFIGGGSAGSVAALGVVYLSQSEWNGLSPSLEKLLGQLNNSGNTLTNTFSIKGIFNDWGAMLKEALQPTEMLPMVSFHGDEDPTVAIDSAYGGGCVLEEKSYGSRAMHAVLVSKGVCSDLSVKPGGGHGVYEDSDGVSFRVGRAACFFKSLFCNSCSSFSQTTGTSASCSVIVGLDDEKTYFLNVYPNPFDAKINVLKLTATETVLLTNHIGQIIYEGSLIEQQDFSQLPEGIYFLKIKDAETTRVVKLIKQ